MKRLPLYASVVAAAALIVPAAPAATVAQSLRGSSASVERQYTVAVRHDFTFLRTSQDIRRFVELGLLVPLTGDANYQMSAVSFAYARPQVRTFVERLAAQYNAACGEPLVVTSLTRPATRQPRNASDESVHPAGMAVDLRVSNRAACRRWLERTLLSLEARQLVESTRERNPAHYHVAVFPMPYEAYVARATAAAAAPAVQVTTALTDSSLDSGQADEAETAEYRVRRGDSWWTIARRFDMDIDELKLLNGIESDKILAGQRILVPAAR